jgi:hypothetical protein
MNAHAVWPRAHNSTKQDLKRDAKALVLQELMKGIILEKEEANTKR